MIYEQAQVKEFMQKAGQEVKDKPELASKEVASLRAKLHLEEAVEEFKEGVEKDDLVLIADSLADSMVVILGTACAYGIDLEPIFNEVMRSNRTKFIDGHRREDGKWIKGPSYEPARVDVLVDMQQRDVCMCIPCVSAAIATYKSANS